MKRITVTITDEKCVEYTQLAKEQGHTLGSLCSFLLQSASITFRVATISAELMLRDAQGAAIDPDEAGDYFGMLQSASQGVAETSVTAPQGVVTAQNSVPVVPPATPQGEVSAQKSAPVAATPEKRVYESWETSPEERAAFTAKRAKADRKRRALFAAMGVSHPADAPLPATFLPGEADFAAAHPELV